MTVLSFIVLLPILAALATAFGAPARKAAEYSSVANLVLSLFAMDAYKPAVPGGFDFGSTAASDTTCRAAHKCALPPPGTHHG